VILAIDPGNKESAFCIIDNELKPVEFCKLSNELLLDRIEVLSKYTAQVGAIERIASYGMSVGQEVFQTCEWVGIFTHALFCRGIPVQYIYRKEVKLNLCGSMKAKDSNITQALKDRFGEVGTKHNQGWFYGFHHDIWSAYAVGVTYLDKAKNTDTVLTNVNAPNCHEKQF
jgi:Holliday junction resolvasome RuvABC endonuclease subunit